MRFYRYFSFQQSAERDAPTAVIINIPGIYCLKKNKKVAKELFHGWIMLKTRIEKVSSKTQSVTYFI